jgi:hypothetical protein
MPFVSERFKEMTAKRSISVPFATTDLYRALSERVLDSSQEEMEHEYDDIPNDPVLEVIEPGKAWIINRVPRGFEVLVAPRVCCIDRDFAAASEAELEMVQSISDEEMLQLVHARLVESELNLQLRVYRTAAGLRMLVESQTLRPDGEVHPVLQRHLQGDEIYAAVCARSKAFAMRLTGKPARVEKLDGQPYAVCRYIGTVGSAGVSADVEAIIEVHDERTRALKGNLPLA